MTERIQELVNQVGTDTSGKWVSIENLHRVAELIVRESTELTLDHPNADYYQGWLDYRDEIRQHWGIEP